MGSVWLAMRFVLVFFLRSDGGDGGERGSEET